MTCLYTLCLLVAKATPGPYTPPVLVPIKPPWTIPQERYVRYQPRRRPSNGYAYQSRK